MNTTQPLLKLAEKLKPAPGFRAFGPACPGVRDQYVSQRVGMGPHVDLYAIRHFYADCSGTISGIRISRQIGNITEHVRVFANPAGDYSVTAVQNAIINLSRIKRQPPATRANMRLA